MTFNCSVCWDPLAATVEPSGGGPVSTDITALRCGHLYHHVCLQDWLDKSPWTQDNAGCPTCRTTINLVECIQLYPSRDDTNTSVSKMKGMKQRIENLEVDLKKANAKAEKERTVQKSLKVDLNSKSIELDSVKEMLIEQRQKWIREESNFLDIVVKLNEEKEKRDVDLQKAKWQREVDLEKAKRQREDDLEKAKRQWEVDLEKAKRQRKVDLKKATRQHVEHILLIIFGFAHLLLFACVAISMYIKFLD